MELELRRPYFVILGNWNPAIFQPGWVGEYVFGIAPGQDFTFMLSQQIRQEVVEQEVLEAKSPTVLYHSQVGISCLSNRLEIYINDLKDETLSLAEQATIRVLDTLSHTPIGPYGINFQFNDADPEAEISDLIETKENLTHVKPVLSRDFRTRMSFNDQCDLNFKRVLNDAGLELNFNFHHTPRSIAQLKDEIPGHYKKYYELLIESFGEKYELQGIEEIEVGSHDFDSLQNEEGE
jgi:hypothetical protein